MKQPESCNYSKDLAGIYICTLCVLPCEKVRECPLERNIAEFLKGVRAE